MTLAPNGASSREGWFLTGVSRNGFSFALSNAKRHLFIRKRAVLND